MYALALAPTHDFLAVVTVLRVRRHELLVAEGPIPASHVEVRRAVQLLCQRQLLLQDPLEERGQRVLDGDPRVAPPLLVLVRPAHVPPVRPHLGEEVSRAPLEVGQRLFLWEVAVVAHERVPQALHGDANLVRDACEDVDVRQRILRVVHLALVVRKGLHKGLGPFDDAVRPPPRLGPIEERVVVGGVLEHDFVCVRGAHRGKLRFDVLDLVLELPVDQAHVALAEQVLLLLHLQAPLSSPGLGRDDGPVRVGVQPLDEAPPLRLVRITVDPELALHEPEPLL
mmetsp:Transcript_30462/g.80790  ORF Transcript_30462/g.80790 Transcript_30462/m.80790 type:complete len:283 (+) Transcript_30462:1773-2621(+)